MSKKKIKKILLGVAVIAIAYYALVACAVPVPIIL
jgi:hypothetical protein|tara:strand:+ start:1521 stop:1625 length:105 start_codon:yes stop_codon:yes gene_type:complete